MEIEWDNNKRDKTLTERGLDFADLKNFDWDGAIYFDDERKDYGEHRQVALGLLDGRLFVVASSV